MDNRQFFLGCCAHEAGLSKKVISAMPEGGLDRRPDPKARTARELIGHIIGHEQDLVELINDGVIHHRNVVEFDTLDQALELYDAAHAELEAKLGTMSDEAWGATVKMWAGDHLAWEASASEIMWGFLFDQIHHRGQLSTYIRPAGGKVPGIYGPSADDMGHA